MEIGCYAPGEEPDMVRSNKFGTGTLTEIAQNTFDEQITRLTKPTLVGQFNPPLHVDSLGTGAGAATAVPALFHLGEYIVKLGLNLPGGTDISQLIMLMGRRGKEEKINLHSLLHQYLATQLGGYF